MADLERPDRITNITGLRAQSGHPDDAGGARGWSGWPMVACRLCDRRVWLFARTCACGMPNPALEARRPYLLPALIAALLLLGAISWWWHPVAWSGR